MSLYLKNYLYDRCLLPPPPRGTIDHHTLLELADTFHQRYAQQTKAVDTNANTTASVSTLHDEKYCLGLEDWCSMAESVLGITSTVAQVYFECFVVVRGREGCVVVDGTGNWVRNAKIRPAEFILFLFAQCCNRVSSKDEMMEGDSYPFVVTSSPSTSASSSASPTSSAETSPVFPRKNSPSLSPNTHNHNPEVTSPSSTTSSSAQHTLSSSSSSSRFSTQVVEGRKSMANYWRTHILQWLTLLYVVNHGRHLESVPHTMSDYTKAVGTMSLNANYMDVLNFVFTAIKPCEVVNTDGSKSIGYCRTEMENLLMESFHIMPSEDSNDAADSSANVSLGLVQEWVLRRLTVERPLAYHKLVCTSNGVARALEDRVEFPCRIEDEEPVFLYRKKQKTILIHAVYITNRALHINRCHDTHIYVLGTLSNLTITNCRNTHITFGAVSGTTTVETCDNVTLRGATMRFVSVMSHSVHLYMIVGTRPLFAVGNKDSVQGWSGCASIHKMNQRVVLAPLNTYFEGMMECLENAGFGRNEDDEEVEVDDNDDKKRSGKLDGNEWDQPLVMWESACLSRKSPEPTAVNEIAQSTYTFLPPEQFTFHRIPWEMAKDQASSESETITPSTTVTTDNATTTPLSPSSSHHKALTPLLPATYADALIQRDQLAQATQKAMETALASLVNTTLTTPSQKELLHSKMDALFSNYLKEYQGGYLLGLVNGCVMMNKDLEKLGKKWNEAMAVAAEGDVEGVVGKMKEVKL